MSHKHKRWLALVFFLALLLSGCLCSENQIDIMEIILDSPAAGELVSSLLPSLGWHNSESCQPDSYQINVKENYESSAVINYTTPDNNPSFTLSGAPLEPGKEYIWKAEAVKDAYGHSSWSEYSIFYTGPVCSGEPLIAPELQDPGPSGWVEHQYDFNWTYNGGCLPLSYEVQFAWDAGFTNIYLTASTSQPYAQHLLMAFPDCSSLFWRVRANDGTTTGPWSEGRDFHYILSGGCYQWHYLSDDFAWIQVRLRPDYCDQTGFPSATTATLHPGCVPDGAIIVGDGSSTSYLSNFVVDLGAGPCPSTGLDQKTADWHVKFGVLTPGTYCVSISRNQTVDGNGPTNLMDGIWTDPRANAIVAEKTIDFGPGTHDLWVDFHWDEIDRYYFVMPLDFTLECKFGPEDWCITYDFAREGQTIPIYGRDPKSDWKLTEINGTSCYIKFPDVLINDYLAKFEGFEPRAEDLEPFPAPAPCPRPTPEPRACSTYNSQDSCQAAGCTWHPSFAGAPGGGSCANK